MITRIPVLEYLGRRVGRYVSSDADTVLVLARVGYGFSIQLTGPRRSSFAAVLGVAGRDVELHALVGFANVVVFSWPHAFDEQSGDSEVVMAFKGKDETSLEFGMSFHADTISVSFRLDGAERKGHVLRKEMA